MVCTFVIDNALFVNLTDLGFTRKIDPAKKFLGILEKKTTFVYTVRVDAQSIC